MFVLKNLTYQQVLNVPGLTISGDQITCLFGPSGCGKTTLLRLLNGMISPDSGTILFQGEDLSSVDLVQHRRHVVMLSQQPTLFAGNVRENLNMGACFQECPPFEDSRLRLILDQVSLKEKSLEENPALFSGGEKQRLVLGRVLLLEPAVLLLDEPGSALDEDTERIVMDSIRKDQGLRKSTCILVTHSKEVAETYSDTIVYLEHGSVTHTEHRNVSREVNS